MNKSLSLIMTALLFTIFLGGCRYMTIDTASPNPKLPPYPVTMYPAGRFMLPVPNGLDISSTVFKVNKITIEEIAWKKGRDREEYLKEVWTTVREREHKTYLRRAKVGPATQGGWAEEDISHLFGYPAMLLCYNGNMADHNIDVHIGLPEAILRLTESRFYPIGKACIDMDSRILTLFKHYRFGNKNVAPDSFFSAGGRVEGLKTWYEQAGIGVKRPASESRPKIYLRFDTVPPVTSEFPKSIYVISDVARKYGMKLNVLRSQKRLLAGMEGREEIFLLRDKDDDEFELTASWRYQGVKKDPEKPDIEIELSCPESAKEEALRMWDAVMKNFTTVREYYGRRS
jgi:hypothetical protein